MPRRRAEVETTADRVLHARQETLVDVIDHLLNKGVLLNGDLTLGVAGVDLIYLRLSALLCAVDRVLPVAPERHKSRRHERPPVRRVRRRDKDS